MNAAEVVRPVRKLRKVLRGSWKMPMPERVHDLRTTARRYAATVQALRCDGKKNERRCLRALERIRGRAGKVRDLDVLTSKAKSLALPEDDDCVVLLLEGLGADRVQQALKLKRTIKRDRRRLRRTLKRTAGRLQRRVRKSTDIGADGHTAANVLATALATAAELAAPVRLNRHTLHPYRLKVKALRDVLQVAAGDDEHGFVRVLGTVKDAIGEWHDWERLIEIAANTVEADHRSTCALARELRATADKKFFEAVSVTTRMRKTLTKRLFKPSPRHHRILTSFAGPLLQTTTAA